MYKYFPQTEKNLRDMFGLIGVQSLDELYSGLPDEVKLNAPLNLPKQKSEIEIRRIFSDLGGKSKSLSIFAGAGVYDKYTPAIIPLIVSRSEFRTSYTPYQAEISQGTLHYIFEFQSMMCRLTGMDVSNASMYDGATATAEAVLMANAVSRKADKVLLSETIDPKVAAVVRTYCKFHGVKVDTIAAEGGVTSRSDMAAKLAAGDVCGVVVQQPNYYGIIEDYSGFADDIHEAKALFIMNSVAADLALLKTPVEWGADVAVGDGQSLGLPMTFGGPYFGYFCTTEKLMRKMPGRIVGQTVDNRGQRTFVLTLQAREQHIRRQKATSNICSNESLMALFATIYMSLMGREGLKDAAQMSYNGAHYMAEQMEKSGAFKLKYADKPFFNEFCMECDNADLLQQKWLDAGFMGGVKIDDRTLMFAVTEKYGKREIDKFLSVI